MTVGEFISTWLENEGKAFRRSERQGGAESTPASTQGGQHGRELRVTEAQFRDPVQYRQLRAKAEKEGLVIVPVP
jgi:hypothetical protein